jgi:MFS superfamily sulfate permease-like transporter
MNEYWFKPKTYGYGATPVTWEGWLVVALYTAAVLICCAILTTRGNTFSHWLSAMVVIVVATVAVIWISVKKTDGAWHWQWGQSRDSGKID